MSPSPPVAIRVGLSLEAFIQTEIPKAQPKQEVGCNLKCLSDTKVRNRLKSKFRQKQDLKGEVIFKTKKWSKVFPFRDESPPEVDKQF